MEAEALQLSTVMGNNAQQLEQILAELEAWASTLNQDADWCMLSIELQLHAKRSPTFAAEYQKVWGKHRSEIGSVISLLFEARAPGPCLAGRTSCCLHGTFAWAGAAKDHRSPDPPGRLIMVFLRGLIASAK